MNLYCKTFYFNIELRNPNRIIYVHALRQHRKFDDLLPCKRSAQKPKKTWSWNKLIFFLPSVQLHLSLKRSNCTRIEYKFTAFDSLKNMTFSTVLYGQKRPQLKCAKDKFKIVDVIVYKAQYVFNIIWGDSRESFVSTSVFTIGQQYFSRLAAQSLTVFCRWHENLYARKWHRWLSKALEWLKPFFLNT